MTPFVENNSKIDLLRERLRKSVVIVGMMGVGKTHIGRKLADRLEWDFMDSDKLIEQKADATINEIFAEYGEEKFRQCERNTILDVLNGPPCILSTGGGAVTSEETRQAIKTKSISVWLKLDAASILKRVQNTDERPLLRTDNPEKTLRDLMEQREPFYKEARIHLEATDPSPDKTLEKLINLLCEHVKDATV